MGFGPPTRFECLNNSLKVQPLRIKLIRPDLIVGRWSGAVITDPPSSVTGRTVNGTTIELSWYPPRSPHSDVTPAGYRILYWISAAARDAAPASTPASLMTSPSSPSSPTTALYNSTGPEVGVVRAMISNLQPATEYQVSVAALTSYGLVGPYSDPVAVLTDVDKGMSLAEAQRWHVVAD